MAPEAKKNKFFMFVSFLLMFFGLTTLSYLIDARDIPTVPVEEQFAPLIFNDKSVFIEIKDLNKDQIAQTVRNAVDTTKVKGGGVEDLSYLWKKSCGIEAISFYYQRQLCSRRRRFCER